jgi:hypothetical protein
MQLKLGRETEANIISNKKEIEIHRPCMKGKQQKFHSYTNNTMNK